MALTVYLAHLLLGERWVWPWLGRAKPSRPVQVAVVGIVLATFAALATIWRARSRRGPVEAIMRAVAD